MADQIPDSAKLLPCPNPWCDSAVRPMPFTKRDGSVQVICGCDFHGPSMASRDEAIAAWTTRAAPPAMDREAVEVTRTSRGFAVARGVDRYGVPYSIQDSSLAEEAAIWLGSDAEAGGRAHLTQDMAAALIPLLQRFVVTGSIAGSGDTVAAQPEAAEPMVRITRDQYPEIIQAARWMDADHGTPHFQPGVGFIVDDPEGLTVPTRWVEHLPIIEAALAGLDHERPHPQDADTLAALVRDGKEPTLYESAVHCFVSGEHTPVTIMAKSSRDLWIANRFLNERCESWAFDPGADFPAEALSTLSADAIRQGEGWQPIETAPQEVWKKSKQVILCHAEKRWTRFGRYYGELKRWYYSGTSERSQWNEMPGDAPTHWMPFPDVPATPASHTSDGGKA